jgi:hypothetical protein
MLLIGDIHGLFHEYKWRIKMRGVKKSLQLGDYGLGFPDTMKSVDFGDIEGDHKFIRGNHDNPAVCRADKNYAGDYGIIDGSYINGKYDKLFFVSGAWSIDYQYRTPGVSWWEDEQLSQSELGDVIHKYSVEKPEIVCSHDCPTIVLYHLHGARVIPTRTSQAMDQMFLYRMPAYWIFAHHHMSWRKQINGCWFICLNELEILDISKEVIETLE